MAIYHLSVQVISRGQGKSCMAAAAYRAGEKLYDERQNINYDYTKKQGVESEIIAPPNAPSWVKDRERLWNEVDKKERRCNSRTAREINLALPFELTKEQQKESVREYVKKNFVNKGMVADVCFHFNDKNNPHCHIMLTTREIEEEKFTQKNREWDKKEKVTEWRKEWEVMTNKVLKDNGISEVITCESNKTLGNGKLPTIHEGYIARDINSKGRESERVNENKVINEYNNTVIDLDKYKEEKKLHDNYKKFYRKFSPREKVVLKNAAKDLKMFINYENANNRIIQLKKWENSLNFKEDSIDKTNKLNRVDKEEKTLNEAIEILETESVRFLKVNYFSLDISSLNIDEKIELVNTTVDNKKILNADEILLLKDKVKEENLEKSLNNIFNNNTRFTKSVKEDIEHIETIFNELVKKYNMNFSKPETLKNVPDKILNNIEKMFNRVKNLKSSLKIINNIYDIKLAKMYPEWNGRVELRLEEKEFFIMSKEYFGKTLMPDDFKNVTCKYNSHQQEEILNILDINNNGKLKEKYPDFKINEIYKNMFYMECYSNKNLNQASKTLINNYFNKDNFMKNFKVSDEFNNGNNNSFAIDRVKSASEKSLLFDVIGTLINEIDKRFQENKFENDRLKKKSQRKKLLNQKKRSQEPSL